MSKIILGSKIRVSRGRKTGTKEKADSPAIRHGGGKTVIRKAVSRAKKRAKPKKACAKKNERCRMGA